MKKFFKFWGFLVFIASLIFAAFQMYLERRIGTIEMKGHAWELAGPKTSNDLAIKWALTELAPCYDLDGFRYIPKDLYNGDNLGFYEKFIENNNGNWLQCRFKSFFFSRSVIQDFSFVDGLFCPSNKGERQGVMDIIYYKRKGLSISNSYFLCVSFLQSRLAGMSADQSFFTGSSFSGSELSRSEWKGGSDLRYVIFDSTNLQGARFSNVNLEGASFEHANLCGAKFDDATLDGTENFDGANVTGANLAGLSMLTERQLSQFCVWPDGSFPTLPAHLAAKRSSIRKCTPPEIEQIQERFPESRC